MTSVDLIMTVTLSPFLRPSCSALRRVITLSTWLFPIFTDEKGKPIKYQVIAKAGYTAPREVE